jgi:hypothetical protein
VKRATSKIATLRGRGSGAADCATRSVTLRRAAGRTAMPRMSTRTNELRKRWKTPLEGLAELGGDATAV